MRLAEEKKVIPVAYSANFNDGLTFDSINMSKGHRCTFVIGFGAITGDAVLTVSSGATNGAATTALDFRYALGGAAIGTAVAGNTASCDVLAATASANNLTLTAATYANKMLLVEVEASAMNVAGAEEWLTAALSDAASAGIAYAFAIVDPRYSNARSDTFLA